MGVLRARNLRLECSGHRVGKDRAKGRRSSSHLDLVFLIYRKSCRGICVEVQNPMLSHLALLGTVNVRKPQALSTERDALHPNSRDFDVSFVPSCV